MTDKEALTTIMLREMESRGVVLVQKGDWRVWWHWFVPAFFWCWGLVNKDTKNLFYTNFWTALANYFYVPDREKVVANLSLYIPIIFHELMHVDDNANQPLWYKLSYICSKRWRAHWEYRAIAQEFCAIIAGGDRIGDAYLARKAQHFTSKMYLYMDKNPMPILVDLRAAAERGDVSVGDMQALSGILEQAYEARAR